MFSPVFSDACQEDKRVAWVVTTLLAFLSWPKNMAGESGRCGVKLGLPLRHAQNFLPTGSTKDPCHDRQALRGTFGRECYIFLGQTFGQHGHFGMKLRHHVKFRSQLLQVDAELRKSRIFCLQPLHHFFLRFSRPWSSDRVNFLTIMNGFWLEKLSVKHDPSARKLAANSCKKNIKKLARHQASWQPAFAKELARRQASWQPALLKSWHTSKQAGSQLFQKTGLPPSKLAASFRKKAGTPPSKLAASSFQQLARHRASWQPAFAKKLARRQASWQPTLSKDWHATEQAGSQLSQKSWHAGKQAGS